MGFVKTFLPTLKFIIQKLHKYATRYQEDLEFHLGTDAKITCLRNLIATLASCVPILFGE